MSEPFLHSVVMLSTCLLAVQSCYPTLTVGKRGFNMATVVDMGNNGDREV